MNLRCLACRGEAGAQVWDGGEVIARRKRSSWSVPVMGWVGSRGLALLPGSWELSGAILVVRILPPERSFSSVSSESLWEPQSKEPGSQTATWKQHDSVQVGRTRENNISRGGIPGGIVTTWRWAVFNDYHDKLKSLSGFSGTAPWKPWWALVSLRQLNVSNQPPRASHQGPRSLWLLCMENGCSWDATALPRALQLLPQSVGQMQWLRAAPNWRSPLI